MKDLLQRLEAEVGPSRELDQDIYHELGLCGRGGNGDPCPDYLAPRYTASIDAALKLVPEDKYWFLAKGKLQPSEPMYGVQILDPITDRVLTEAEHDNAAIALCIAALKARQSLQESSHE